MALLDRNYQIAAPLTTDKPKTTLIACKEEVERSLKFLKSFHMKRESNHLKSISQSRKSCEAIREPQVKYL